MAISWYKVRICGKYQEIATPSARNDVELLAGPSIGRVAHKNDIPQNKKSALSGGLFSFQPIFAMLFYRSAPRFPG